MEIYANALTEEALRREFIYVFNGNKYPGIPKINLNTISAEPFIAGDIPIIPISVYHLNMPVLGFRFGKFTYITDANRIDDNERKKIKGSEVIVLNALRREKHISHFTLNEAIKLVNDLNIPQAYFTHMSHQIGRHNEINNELPEGIELAWDGLTLIF
jgi:phosphoribosyl 1,2-cyclic phosphate phosphodiesterase